jgi:peroxiredoxin
MTKKQLKDWLLRMSLFITIFALAGGTLGCSPPSPSSSPEELGLIVVEGEVEAPDFTLPTMTGTEITLSELQGTPVVLNFWAIRCPPCRQELPYFDTVARQNVDKATILTVNLEDSTSQIEQFFSNSEVSFIVALDKNAQMTSSYATGYIPTTFLVDSQGIVRYAKVGAFASEEQLQASLDLILEAM